MDAARQIDDSGLSSALANDLVGNQGGKVPTLRYAADYARQASGRFFRNPNTLSVGNAAPQALQDTWTYIDLQQISLVWLLLNYHQTQDEPDVAYMDQEIVRPYLGNPPLKPDVRPATLVPPSERTSMCPNSGVTEVNCMGWRDRELRLVPQALPKGTTIDTATGLMWLQNIGSRDGEGVVPTDKARTLSGYNRDNGGSGPSGLQTEPDCSYTVWSDKKGSDCPSVYRVAHMAASVNAGKTDWKTPTKSQLDRLVRPGIDGPTTGTKLPEWLSSAGGFFWMFGPVDGSRTDTQQRSVATIGTEVCIDGARRVCTRPEPRAYTSTSNGQQNMICDIPEWPKGCFNGSRNEAVNLLTGESTFGEVWRYDANGLWAMAVRPLTRCEFYFDDVSGPSPADRDGCGLPGAPTTPTTPTKP